MADRSILDTGTAYACYFLDHTSYSSDMEYTAGHQSNADCLMGHKIDTLIFSA